MSASSTELRPLPPLRPTLRDSIPWLILAAIAGAVLGYFVMVMVPPTYLATATARVGPGLTNVGEPGSSSAQTEQAAEMATLTPQLTRIAEQVSPGPGVDELRSKLVVKARPETALLDFSFASSDEAKAEEVADVAARTYLQQAQRLANDQLVANARALRSANPGQPSPGAVALSSVVVDAGSLLVPAEDTAEHQGLPGWVYPPLGMLAALVLALTLCYLIETLRPRVRRGAPTLISGAPFLGRIPKKADAEDVASGFVVGRASDVAARPLAIAVVGGGHQQVVSLAEEAIHHGAAEDRSVVAVDLASAPGLLAARKAGEVILLVPERVTKADEVEAAVDRVRRLGAEVVGVVSFQRRGRAGARNRG